jgi:hypothetical protein
MLQLQSWIGLVHPMPGLLPSQPLLQQRATWDWRAGEASMLQSVCAAVMMRSSQHY